MSYSLSKLKNIKTGECVYDLSYDTADSHYLFNENKEFIRYYEFYEESLIDDEYVIVRDDPDVSEKEYSEIFKELKQKVHNI